MTGFSLVLQKMYDAKKLRVLFLFTFKFKLFFGGSFCCAALI
jgi:hypothetical protein